MGSHPLELMLALHIPSWLLKRKYKLLLKNYGGNKSQSTSKQEEVWLSNCITIAFFGVTNPYKKIDGTQQQFFEYFVLYIYKGYKAVSSCENVWLRRLILR